MKNQDNINLILKYFDHVVSEEEFQKLEHLLCTDAEFQDLFLQLSLQNILLYKEHATTGEIVSIPNKASMSRRGLVAAAALLVAALTGISWFLFVSSYPDPVISGPVQIGNSNRLDRGSELKTIDQPAVLNLGGYCTIDIAPQTTIILQGEPSRESVFVEQGKITCDVVPRSGTFDVHTMLGVVRVKGTRFSVEVRSGETEMSKMEVSVQRGSVAVTSNQQKYVLAQGDVLVLPEPDDAPVIHTQGGPMVTKGSSLYIATPTTLSKVDSATGNILLKKDISFTNTTMNVQIHQENIRKNMLSHKLLSFLRKYPDEDKSVLLLTSDSILLLRNGIIYIFSKDSLEFSGYKKRISESK